MSVYVNDQATPYHGSINTVMVADTLSELNEMADKIGLSRSSYDHENRCYVVTQTMRLRAISNGALTACGQKILFVAKGMRDA